MKHLIRKKTKEDCKAVANVVTVAWEETYKGIVPDWFFEQLKNNEDERTKKALEQFDINDNNCLVLEVDDKVVGFVNYGATSDEDYKNCGEIIALYIISKYKGNGFGKKLVEKAVEELKKLGFDKMIIACLKGNSSNDFYKHIGGVYVKDGNFERLNLPENIYYFENM